MTTPVMVALVRVCNEANYGVPHDEVWVAKACLELDDLRAFFEKYTALQQLYRRVSNPTPAVERFFGITGVIKEELEPSDDALAGLTCTDCGVLFSKRHNHRVLCEVCWGISPPDSLPKATYPRRYKGIDQHEV